MAPDTTPEIEKIIYKIISYYFEYTPGVIIFFIVLLLAVLWWNWKRVRQLPGFKKAVYWLTKKSLPKADPNRIAVAVAHIDDDKEREVEKLITEALNEFKGIQPLCFDELITIEGSYPEDREKDGYTKARKLLKKTGAQVLIWGRIIRGRPKLYWTSSEVAEKALSYGHYPITENIELPAIFWEDLANVLRLLITTQVVEFNAAASRCIGDEIRPFIAKVCQLLKGSENKPGWNQEARAQTWVILGDSLQVLGTEKGENHVFIDAIHAYQEALKVFTRERVPLYWAMTKHGLGNALLKLGDRENETAKLEEAVAAYQEALKVFTRARVPLYWAMTKNSLRHTLRCLKKHKKRI